MSPAPGTTPDDLDDVARRSADAFVEWQEHRQALQEHLNCITGLAGVAETVPEAGLPLGDIEEWASKLHRMIDADATLAEQHFDLAARVARFRRALASMTRQGEPGGVS